jgi:hypothetical protein
MLKMTKCRKCKAPINMEPAVTTPTCPVCGTWWPQGLQGFWIIVAILAGRSSVDAFEVNKWEDSMKRNGQSAPDAGKGVALYDACDARDIRQWFRTAAH